MNEFPERLAALQPFWGEWYLESLIGKGSYGQVYRIRKTDALGTAYEAALKWLWLPQDSGDRQTKLMQGYTETQIEEEYASNAALLREEILMMRRLGSNSHIVHCEDFDLIRRKGEPGWDILIRMELLTPLPSQFAQGMTVGDVVQMGLDLCDALAACEAEGIIHRDIKPDNIFVSSSGSYKLGDFGVAKQMEHTTAELSRAGTPLYMAPEVWRGNAKANATVDLYSLALVMHRLLNRQRMPLVTFSDHIPTHAERNEALERRFNRVPVPPPVDGGPALQKVICKACEYLPQRRYHSAADMREALLAAAKTTKMDEPLNVNPAEGVGLNSGRSLAGRRARPKPRRRIAWTVAVLVPVALAGVTFLLLQNENQPGSSTWTEVPVLTAMPTAAPTATPNPTPTATPIVTSSPTPTVAQTATPSTTPTATPTVTSSATPTATPTATPSPTPTAAPTATPSPTPTTAPTATPSPTPDRPDWALSDGTVPVASVFSNHHLVGAKTHAVYSAELLVDGKEETSWQFKTTDFQDADGVYAQFDFACPVTLHELWIKNGFWKITKGLDQYTRNGRPRTLELRFRYAGSDRYTDALPLALKDDSARRDWQKLTLGEHAQVISVRMYVVDVWTGSAFPEDVAISEIQFMY